VGSSTVVTRYLVQGVRVELRTPDEAVSEALHYRLRAFHTVYAEPPQYVFEYVSVTAAELERIEPPAGEHVRVLNRSEVSEVLYEPGTDLLYLSSRHRMKTLCQANAGLCRVFYPAAELTNLWRLTHPMFTLPFVDCLRRSGRYTVHAAGLCVDGKGLLFPGESGYGKTTLTLALLRAGYGFLSDDLVLLERAGERIRMLGFPDEIDVTEDTARMFPELAPVLELPARPDWPKRQVSAPEVYGADFVAACEPAAVVCPRIAYSDQTRLEPLSPQEAFFELVPSVHLTEQRASQAHLDLLGDLLRQVPCYRMHTGRDLAALPGHLAELIA
jgi:hypothetical protein